MLDSIELKNFKCFSSLRIPLKNLNVFTGLNGMGKSTVIQSILLLKQSLEQGFPMKQIVLNGTYVSLGTGQDILFENALSDDISICLKEGELSIEILPQYVPTSDILEISPPISQMCDTFSCGFEYLNAERLAPKTVYEKSSYAINNDQLGIYGQYTAHYLSIHQDDPVDPYGGAAYKTLKDGVQFWLNEVSPNVRLNVTQVLNADLAQINYYYTGLSDSTKSREYRPTNVGFGISYILPIITALLKAPKGSILIIENPEAHLHPKGQRKIGELISWCASRGVQIFLETHSDHVLNGIRISTKKLIVQPDQVKLFFFINPEGGIAHEVESPTILPNGKLDYWPDGFFDEWEKALDEII